MIATDSFGFNKGFSIISDFSCNLFSFKKELIVNPRFLRLISKPLKDNKTMAFISLWRCYARCNIPMNPKEKKIIGNYALLDESESYNIVQLITVIQIGSRTILTLISVC